MDIAAGVALGGQMVTLLKELNKVDKEFDKTELKLKIGDLVDKTLAMKIALSEASDALAQKDAEIGRLKATIRRSPELCECEGFLYEPDNAGKPDGHPYCPRCYAADGFLMRTVRGSSVMISTCPQCKCDYHRVSTTAWEAEAREVEQIQQRRTNLDRLTRNSRNGS
jgi:hypothetical protein